MRLPLACALLLPACLSSQDTGSATLSTNGAAAPTVSAWAFQPTDAYLLGPSGNNAYLPWQIMFGSVPPGTDCSSGTGHGSLQHDASSWLVAVQVAVPPADKDSPLSPGPIALGELSSLGPAITAPRAEVQVFDPTPTEDVLTQGTLTITTFGADAITGTLDATGSGATTTVSATFTANRCDF